MEEKEKEKEFEQNIQIGDIEDGQKEEIRKLIRKYSEICAISDTKLGRTNIVKHRINTGDNKPVSRKPYRANEEKEKMIKEELDKMIKDGVVRESESPWSSPVVIIDKKDGSKRFCIDYRWVNIITETDAYPLPRIDDLLEQFRGAEWFSSIDLASGYWQIEMDEKDRKKTAFTCHLGLYEFNVMPFGLKNAPPTFQRMMNKILREWLREFVVVYIDDIMIYSKTFEEHLEQVEKVLKKLKKKSKFNEKCKWGEQNIGFLGHRVGKDGLKPDPGKIEKIRDIKIPTTVREVRAVLGLFSYYRKFVEGFSKIAKPLNELLKKESEFKWGERQQKAFEELKERLIKHPILEYPNFEKEFILITDASGEGLGAVLSQLNDQGKEAVIAYGSKSLKPAEKNYVVTEQECLAIVWGIEHFHKYLVGRKFTIVTDHSALKTLQTSKIPKKGRRARWMMELQQYDFEIKHRAGKNNGNADALSRLKYKKEENLENLGEEEN